MVAETSPGVMLWWRIRSAIGVVNIVAWILLAECFRPAVRLADSRLRREYTLQVILSALFVFGCAYRSFFPFAEGQRFCLSAPPWSNAVVSRAIATVAELAIVAQWAV